MVGVHADAKAHAQHAFFARRQRCQNPRRGFFQVFLNCAVQGQDGVLVFDEVAELAVFLVADGGFEGNRLLGDFHHLADLFQRHLQLFGQLFRRRFAADFVQHLPTGADQFVDRFDHMHGNTDRAGLVGDRAGDGLTDPPGRVGREFITATIFKLIDGLHQAYIAFLNQIQELQAAIGVFLGDGNHQTQVRLDHFLFGLTRLFLALLDLIHDAAEFGNIHADIGADARHFGAQFLNLFARTFHQRLPAATGFGGHAVQPGRVQFVALIFFDEFAAVDPGGIGQFHHAGIDHHDAAVDAIKLVDQRVDPVVVQVQFVDQHDDFGSQLLIGRFVTRGKAGLFGQGRCHAQILHRRQLAVVAGDKVQRFQDLRL